MSRLSLWQDPSFVSRTSFAGTCLVLLFGVAGFFESAGTGKEHILYPNSEYLESGFTYLLFAATMQTHKHKNQS